MKKQKTLFTRYKNMINSMWDDGQRKYTANELNMFVGGYENQTQWKRWSNNPFYTTRTYQTILKELGCISMVKRGVWQINGPIPHWFSSLHLKALKSKSAAAELEKSSYVWASMPSNEKVNPWKSSQQPLNLNSQADRDQYLRSIYPANVEGSVAFNNANKETKDRIRPEDNDNLLTKLKSLLDEVEKTNATKPKIPFNVFASIVTKFKKMDKKLTDVQNNGVNLIDFVEDYNVIINMLLESIYGEEGLDVFCWWCYDKNWGTAKNITMVDQDNKLMCESIEELHEYLESLPTAKSLK